VTIRSAIFHLVAVAGLAVPIVARATGSATGDCAARTGMLRERLEAVTEAAIDGQPAAAPAAADSVQAWWRAHGASLGEHPGADTLISNLVRTAHGGHANDSARLAVRLSTDSFRWCAGGLSTPDQLMVLDLTGQAAWLSAKGLATKAPANSRAVSDTLRAALERAQHADLAARLKTAWSAVQPQPGGKAAGAGAAVRLLDLVDDIEKVLH
jgi:hypothetical protein